MFRLPARHLLPALLALATATSADAQEWSGRGRLNGSVTDEAGKPITNAQITLRLEEIPDAGPPPMQSDKRGKWSFLGLVGGNWTVQVAAEGFVISEGLVKVNEFQPNPVVALKLRKAEAAAPSGPSAGDQVRAALGKGNDLLAAGRAAEARAEYETALPLLEQQYHPLVLRAIAQAYATERNWEAALAKLREALAIDANDASTVQLFAKTLADSGAKDHAIDALRGYVDRHPEDQGSLQLLIGILVAAQRNADAALYSARLPEGAGLDPNTMLNMGINLYNDSKLPEALAQFERVVAAKPDWADGFYYRGLARIGLNDTAGAKADFEKVLALDPNHANAELCREFLKSL